MKTFLITSNAIEIGTKGNTMAYRIAIHAESAVKAKSIFRKDTKYMGKVWATKINWK